MDGVASRPLEAIREKAGGERRNGGAHRWPGACGGGQRRPGKWPWTRSADRYRPGANGRTGRSCPMAGDHREETPDEKTLYRDWPVFQGGWPDRVTRRTLARPPCTEPDPTMKFAS
ncbi:protein of unknown function [Azospirillum lipoferum 4B]|uniref:Uncharacterized protein n=1 Tax=Azospirillum lipoferum (strain 4B) TaxID=862719 RepID=G7Z5D2_AZOL4|nr:protein of unknown function [Azospirillum lipoferum 4B]